MSAASYAVWAVLGAAAIGLWARSHSSRATTAGPAAVVERLATGPLARVILVLVWMFAGWHFFAR